MPLPSQLVQLHVQVPGLRLDVEAHAAGGYRGVGVGVLGRGPLGLHC